MIADLGGMPEMQNLNDVRALPDSVIDKNRCMDELANAGLPATGLPT